MSVEAEGAVFGTIATSARVVLAIVFLVAGIPKAVNGKDLANTLRSLGVQRRGGVITLRFAVPIAETVLGVWLLTGVYPAAASFAALTVLLVFTYALMELRKREDAACACFVWDDGAVGVGHVARNLVLVTLAGFVGIVTLLRWYTWEPLWKLPTQSALVVAASVLFVFVVYALVAKSFQFAASARRVMTEGA
jgi:uncharacterized membrane protein YphA (DoxX/SURF4 family)